MQWSVPRELLWAIIGAQAIAIIALWPTYYPYRQAPKVDAQHQSENGISSANPAEDRPATQVNPSGKYESQHSGEDASEISILGIKPGEWLLSIVTLMLWGATVGLVRSADRTAERQLRAYFDLRGTTVEDFEVGKLPNVILQFKNVGQTPAIDVVLRMSVQVRDFVDEPGETDPTVTPGGSKSTIGRDGSLISHLRMSEPLSRYSFEAVRNDKAAFFAWGIVRYSDVYGHRRYLRFRMAFTAKNFAAGNETMETCSEGNDAN
ncbi:hypothetical protein [Bradyrhizobium canariense]|uniref:Uncharacterized protein n=1 Tax=Bradyrhizobium canariense TaxID=255045 RepID=A0A1H1P3N5_9BRAD|nr:hypothetical protein [Bradyrhizobium canariense]SDS05625.1 hypothetical protein SAMN05444158_0861 [Bradyrhizobium canariense]